MDDKHQAIDQMKLQALLAEYQQLYEHNRHDNNIGSAIQGFLATAAFLILGSTYQYEQPELFPILLAALTSIPFYICYLVYFEQLRLIIYTRVKRIAEIEDELSNAVNKLEMNFNRTIEKRIEAQKVKELSDGSGKLSGLAKISFFFGQAVATLFPIWVSVASICPVGRSIIL